MLTKPQCEKLALAGYPQDNADWCWWGVYDEPAEGCGHYDYIKAANGTFEPESDDKIIAVPTIEGLMEWMCKEYDCPISLKAWVNEGSKMFLAKARISSATELKHYEVSLYNPLVALFALFEKLEGEK